MKHCKLSLITRWLYFTKYNERLLHFIRNFRYPMALRAVNNHNIIIRSVPSSCAYNEEVYIPLQYVHCKAAIPYSATPVTWWKWKIIAGSVRLATPTRIVYTSLPPIACWRINPRTHARITLTTARFFFPLSFFSCEFDDNRTLSANCYEVPGCKLSTLLCGWCIW